MHALCSQPLRVIVTDRITDLALVPSIRIAHNEQLVDLKDNIHLTQHRTMGK